MCRGRPRSGWGARQARPRSRRVPLAACQSLKNTSTRGETRFFPIFFPIFPCLASVPSLYYVWSTRCARALRNKIDCLDWHFVRIWAKYQIEIMKVRRRTRFPNKIVCEKQKFGHQTFTFSRVSFFAPTTHHKHAVLAANRPHTHQHQLAPPSI